MKQGERAVDRRNPSDLLGGLVPSASATTFIIALINTGLFLATAILSSNLGTGGGFMDIDPRVLDRFGAKWPPEIWAGEWWRLITAGYLHGDLLHIAVNTYTLFNVGPLTEDLFGLNRFLVIYTVATITGFLASTMFSASLSIGASAGLFGLIGAVIALGIRGTSSTAAALKSRFVMFTVYGLAIGFFGGFRIDNAAHIGGLTGGFAVAYVAGQPKLIDNAAEKFWRAAAILCVALTVGAFGLMFSHLL